MRSASQRSSLRGGVAVAAVRDGAIVSSRTVSLRLRADAGLSFVSDALPLLRAGRVEESPGWLAALRARLDAAGVTELSGPHRAGRSRLGSPVAVTSARETPLMTEVRKGLALNGIDLRTGDEEPRFVVADLSGLDTHAAKDLVRELHLKGSESFSLWRQGGEMFFGPWTTPGHTACWNCARLRMFGAPSDETDTKTVEPDPARVRAVVENVLLVIRDPDLAPFGCVVADDGDSSELHSVVPMPWCDVCGGAAAFTGESNAWSMRFPIVPDELSVLADKRAGVLRHLRIFEGDEQAADSLPICASADIASYHQAPFVRPRLAGEGKGATRAAAVRSAIGEGLERYSASLWDSSRLIRASLDELGGEAFDPRWLVLYDHAALAQPGFPYAEFSPEQPIDWVDGRWLDHGTPVRLPALATFMHFPVAAGEQFAQITSNGLAAGTTFAGAALSALYELIERDAFMLFWLARRPGLRIDPGGCDPVALRAMREAERLGAEVELYLLDAGTQHATVLCLGLGDGSSWPGATIGMAAHADIDVALTKAALEHGHYGAYVRRLMLEDAHAGVRTASDVRNGLDHGLYYVSPDRRANLDALRAGAGLPAALSELRARYHRTPALEDCVACLGQAGIRTAAADVTSPDVALAPIRVVRAFGKYMQPIHFGSANRRLANPRLQEFLTYEAEHEPHPLA